jgi:hypothetical protein
MQQNRKNAKVDVHFCKHLYYTYVYPVAILIIISVLLVSPALQLIIAPETDECPYYPPASKTPCVFLQETPNTVQQDTSRAVPRLQLLVGWGLAVWPGTPQCSGGLPE